jgi:uncharacterized protein YjbJ (UPF0337 family)
MGSKTDKLKGRIKEAIGVLTDNDDLQREGQRDQVVGELKEQAEQVAEKVKEQVKRAVEKVKEQVNNRTAEHGAHVRMILSKDGHV